jgi:hypothetical protein
MDKFQRLIQTLEKSVERHGEKPLTNAWLLNILKMTEELSHRADDLEDLRNAYIPDEHDFNKE